MKSFSLCGRRQDTWQDDMSSPTETPLPSTPPPKKTKEERAFIVFRRLCEIRLPYLRNSDHVVMRHVLHSPDMKTVWTYAVLPYNRPAFTAIIQKLQALTDYIVEKNKD